MLHDQLHAIQLKPGNAQLTRQQASQHIRHYAHLIQLQGACALTERNIVSGKYGRKTLPEAFQFTDLHWHGQRFTGLVFGFQTVFGDQRHQLAPETDIQRRQYQRQST